MPQVFTTPVRRSVAFFTLRPATGGLPFAFVDALLAQRRMPVARKRIFRLARRHQQQAESFML